MRESIIVLHFHSKYRPYYELSLWQWRQGELGHDAAFTMFDSFGACATLVFESKAMIEQVGVLAKTNNWSFKTQDYWLKLRKGSFKTEVWIIDGDPQVYYSRQAAITSHHYSHRRHHAFDMAINSAEFDRKWGFSGWLGFQYQPHETEFRVWAPTAEQVELILYDSTEATSSVRRVIPMARGDRHDADNHESNTHGVWFLTIHENLNFHAYAYRIHYRKRTFKDSRDPYSKAVTSDGKRSVVISNDDMRPEKFDVKHGKQAPWRLENPNQSVICEMHIRDFTHSETSGVPLELRGTFNGAHLQGTQNHFGDQTGFDYLKSMGYSHVQLQPIFDHHQTILPDGSYAYNWGYDPENYNVPEASFSTNPQEPATRILELKQMIQAYHDAGIGVIMDVVYNHTYSTEDSPFQLTVPDYYYRMNADGSFQDGSGCGNETASEKEMFRKYMIDSLVYWVTEYGIDGFRFDLMGLHDVTTMQCIRQEMDAIDPKILLYGEGWDMGTALASSDKAKKANAEQLDGIGFFNDDVRNAIKGAEVYGHFEKGFVSGQASENVLAKNLLGSDELNPYLRPSQVINYIEAHDNYNLNDLLWELHLFDDVATHKKRVLLATVMNLSMQGIAFMQLGQEFLRTKLYATGKDGEMTVADKQRAMNSYNAPDLVNQIDWNLVTFNKEMVEAVKTAINSKRYNPLLSLRSFKDIRENIFISSAVSGSGRLEVAFTDGSQSYMIFDANEKNYEIVLTNVKNSTKM